jgi:Flp pilus assembly protein TadD
MPMLDAAQVHAVTTLAWRLLCGGRAEDACVLFELLVKLMPARMELRLALAHALLGCGKPFAALSELEVLGSSHDPAAHFLSGKALARVGRMAGARVAFDRYRECRQAHLPHAPL